LAQILAMLPTIRPRLYSISSSPLASPTRCAITWSLVDHAPPQGLPLASPTPGLCSHFLASRTSTAGAVSSELSVAIKRGQKRFRPPADSVATPVIMICAGSGIAPFRAFIQHRASLIQRQDSKSRTQLAPALLFFGGRSPAHVPYAEELAAWEVSGAVTHVLFAFSRDQDKAAAGCRYVQDRVWAERSAVMQLWNKGGSIYVCGSQAMSEGLKETMKKIWIDAEIAKGLDNATVPAKEDAEAWFMQARKDRYAVDVF
jgi:cytochrome P450/NADPH-cytochrome P450 reductase